MRTALRSAAALALAVPLIATALPASASSTYTSRESGSYADVPLTSGSFALAT